MCYCTIGCQHSTLNRLFGCVFLVWRHHLRIIDAHFQTFFSTMFLFLTFLNIHIYFIILKTYDQQFTLTTKKSLHIIFKICSDLNPFEIELQVLQIRSWHCKWNLCASNQIARCVQIVIKIQSWLGFGLHCCSPAFCPVLHIRLFVWHHEVGCQFL